MRGLHALGFFAFAGQSLAADYSDPTWPCIQRKVPELSVGLMWPGEIDDLAPGKEAAMEIDRLAQQLALRRVTLAEAETAVAAFRAERHEDLLPQVFLAVFDALSRERRRIIEGIGIYAARQERLAIRIDEARREMADLEASAEPDWDRLEELERQISWDERIFRERQQALPYLCETPVILERRLYSLAQLLQSAG